jgi:hypothetical protein
MDEIHVLPLHGCKVMDEMHILPLHGCKVMLNKVLSNYYTKRTAAGLLQAQKMWFDGTQ